MDTRTLPSRFRPVPFWSWNARLTPDETREQIRDMNFAGIGGFFMHARGGLETEYMGDEWFDNVSAAIDEARQNGMHAWAYDENGWPSGFGGGKVNGKGEYYCQKYLRRAEEPDKPEHLIARTGGLAYYFEVNPFYVDVLDDTVTRDFVREIYQPYFDKYGTTFDGFFTDEPQISRNGIPWSNVMAESYRAFYGDDLLPHLPELFEEVGDYKATRVRFWKLVTDLFSRNFMKIIYDWCTSHGLSFTGHLVLEETFLSQITSNGACMPHYEYFTIPGMDWLGRHVNEELTAQQLGSAAAQLGKKQVLSESFALCGHNVSFDELRMIYAQQMLRGVNLLCQHLEGYSLRGIRKRDYPPAMFRQQPWWPKYEAFCTSMARMGMILSEGTATADTLLLHPQTSAWILYDDGENKGLDEFYARFRDVVNRFEHMHISYHLGDETLIERHGRVEGDSFVIGKMRYHTLVIPEHLAFLPSTEKLLDEFRAAGGRIVTPDEVMPDASLTDDPDILWTERLLPDGSYAWFVFNYSDTFRTARVRKGASLLDPRTGDKLPFDGTYRFAPYEPILVMENAPDTSVVRKTSLSPLDLSGEWTVEEASPNLLTLDRCDYYFDGVLQEKDGYVLDILYRALALGRPVRVRQEYHVSLGIVPDDITLLLETPEAFRLTVNGKAVENKDSGWYIDKCFRKIPLAGCLAAGDNTIALECDFVQSAEVYENLRKSMIFESEKNKLRFDREIEPVYLMGSFGVFPEGDVAPLDRTAFRTDGRFRVGELPHKVTLTHLEQQGFLFFAGSLTLSRGINVDDTDKCVALLRRGVNAADVAVNGQPLGTVLFRSDRPDASRVLHPGENTVRLTLRNNLRNLMGPHHLKEGESYSVGPHSFFREACVFSPFAPAAWDDGYCFTELSVYTDE